MAHESGWKGGGEGSQQALFPCKMAEGVGFEPTNESPRWRFSSSWAASLASLAFPRASRKKTCKVDRCGLSAAMPPRPSVGTWAPNGHRNCSLRQRRISRRQPARQSAGRHRSTRAGRGVGLQPLGCSYSHLLLRCDTEECCGAGGHGVGRALGLGQSAQTHRSSRRPRNHIRVLQVGVPTPPRDELFRGSATTLKNRDKLATKG